MKTTNVLKVNFSPDITMFGENKHISQPEPTHRQTPWDIKTDTPRNTKTDTGRYAKNQLTVYEAGLNPQVRNAIKLYATKSDKPGNYDLSLLPPVASL